MRSATYNEFGKPTEVLSLGDSPIPEPKPTEVRVKTVLASIHNHDLLTIRGQYGFKPEMPAIAGSEAVGVVDAVGSEVKNLKVGQRVAAASVQATWRSILSLMRIWCLPSLRAWMMRWPRS